MNKKWIDGDQAMVKKDLQPDSFAALVWARCDALNLKQKHLCERLRISQSTVSTYMRGVCQPGWEQIMAFAVALECSPRDLVPERVPAEYVDKLSQREEKKESAAPQAAAKNQD
jgi:transcriptional regulator with XRE-family HTH domain